MISKQISHLFSDRIQVTSVTTSNTLSIPSSFVTYIVEWKSILGDIGRTCSKKSNCILLLPSGIKLDDYISFGLIFFINDETEIASVISP